MCVKKMMGRESYAVNAVGGNIRAERSDKPFVMTRNKWVVLTFLFLLLFSIPSVPNGCNGVLTVVAVVLAHIERY